MPDPPRPRAAAGSSRKAQAAAARSGPAKRASSQSKPAPKTPSKPLRTQPVNGQNDLPTLSVQRVQSSYIQVADQLRDLIIHGSLAPGRRLPPEAELAPLFGVSR